MAYTIGLDLGTTASAAAVNDDGKVSMFNVSHEDVVIPSVVYLGPDGVLLVGDSAERRAKSDPAGIAREFKRRFGDSLPLFLNGSPVAANDLMLTLATHLVNEVSAQRGTAPAHIVVCHPANWGDYKVALLSDTLTNSPLPSHTLITEPAAAAIHGANQGQIEVGSIIAVYDLGGGTFDVALLRKLEDGWIPVGRPGGIERLGGIDFDTAVLQHVISSLNLDLTSFDDSDPAAIVAMERLREECRAAKHALSLDTDVTIPVLLPGVNESVRITRSEFEALVSPALHRTLEAFDTMVAASPIEMADIDQIMLVGGSSGIPLVHQQVRSHTGRPVTTDRHPKHSVALGAAASISSEADAVEVVAAEITPPTEAPPVAPEAKAAAPRVRDMYQLPHISEAPLPDFMSKRRPPGPPPSGASQHPPRVTPPAQPLDARATAPTSATTGPVRATPAQQVATAAPVRPPSGGSPPPSTGAGPKGRALPPGNAEKSNRAGFAVVALLLLAILGGGVFAALKARDTTTAATATTNVSLPETNTTEPAVIATAAVPTTVFLGTPCRVADRPDPAVAYRVSEIPDDEIRQTLNGRNIPSIRTIDGIESTPITEFPEFSILPLTYEDCSVDTRGRAWWGVAFGDQVVWSSTLFIEPAP